MIISRRTLPPSLHPRRSRFPKRPNPAAQGAAGQPARRLRTSIENAIRARPKRQPRWPAEGPLGRDRADRDRSMLTPRQQRFVEEYLVDLNATRAAIRAGYSRKTAQEQSSRLLSNVMVAAAVATAQAKRSERTEITQDRVLTELAKIGFANMADYMVATPGGDPYLDFSALTRDQAAALQEVTVEDYLEGRGENAREVKRVKFKLADKPRCARRHRPASRNVQGSARTEWQPRPRERGRPRHRPHLRPRACHRTCR